MTVQIDTTAENNGVRFVVQGAHPSNPSAGHVLLYYVTGTASPGMFVEDNAGHRYGPFITGSSSSISLVSDKKTVTAGDYTGLTSATFADLDATNLSISLTTGAHKCLIVVTAAGVYTSGSGALQLDVTVDGTRQGQTFGLILNTIGTTNDANFSFSYITNSLTAATHAFKIQYRVGGGGTAKFYASTSITPFIFAVYELPS